jgi:hypothetical protein
VRSLAFVCVVLVGCIPLPHGRSLSEQEIAGKSGDSILIARSGDVCRVSSNVFESRRVGDFHRCIWESALQDERTAGDPRRAGMQRPPERPRVPPIR